MGRRYRVLGMDCARDAAEIEKAARAVGVDGVKVSAATHVLTLGASGHAGRVQEAIGQLGYRLEPLARDLDGALDVPAHKAPGYRRALWIVVLLNVGYGLVEMIGGFLSESQAVKADALDFLGDGSITFLGLLAIGWTMARRARAALLQGVFLGALGLGVIVNTAYRVFARPQPEAELMGAFGVLALVVNVGAAVALIPHRSGDATVRAVWLFSRNDAVGNLAVVIAAGLVAWTGTPWPDLFVAIVIAGLFLHSSSAIVRGARGELRRARY